jgi:hypothetical protein
VSAMLDASLSQVGLAGRHGGGRRAARGLIVIPREATLVVSTGGKGRDDRECRVLVLLVKCGDPKHMQICCMFIGGPSTAVMTNTSPLNFEIK